MKRKKSRVLVKEGGCHIRKEGHLLPGSALSPAPSMMYTALFNTSLLVLTSKAQLSLLLGRLSKKMKIM